MNEIFWIFVDSCVLVVFVFYSQIKYLVRRYILESKIKNSIICVCEFEKMEDTEVKKLVNKIFAMKGLPKVTNFAQEFSNGGKYQH